MAAQYRLVVKSGEGIGTVYALEAAQISLGRDQNNDIVFSEIEVSRHHARLIRYEDTFLLEDLGSTNGTFVNGQRVSAPYALRPGDEIALGPNLVLVFEQVFDPGRPADAAAQIQQGLTPPAGAPTPPPAAPPAAPPAPPEAAPLPWEEVPAAAEPATPPPTVAPEPPPVAVAPTPPPTPPPPRKSSGKWVLLILVLLILMACLAIVAALWYIDAHNMWCQVFPFVFNALNPGVCP